MRVHPKALIERLSPESTRALEASVVLAATGRAYEIVAEHVLAALLREPEASKLLRDLGSSPERALLAVERALQRLRSGNAGKPVFAESVLTWFEEAWLVASIERGRQRLRPGDLLHELCVNLGRYTGEVHPELAKLPRDTLRELVDGLGGDERIPQAPGEPLATGETNAEARGEALSQFTISLTERARAGSIDPIFGRDREIRQVIDVLARRRKNNPILVGEPGVGKTAIVEGLARAIVAGDAPKSLHTCDLRVLDLGLLAAAAGVRGELERRLKAVLAEIKGSARPVILFIDEAHMLLGGKDGDGELANLLKPELARGEVRTIAATTWSEYKRYFEKDAALARRFQPVKIDEPDTASAALMLRGLRSSFESAHNVIIRDEAVVAAVELSDRYIAGRYLPDKAVDLLDTAAARVKIEREAPPEALTRMRTDLAAARFELEGIDRDLGDGLPRSGRDELAARVADLVEEERDLEQRWRAQEALALDIEARQAELRALAVDDPARVDARAAVEHARALLTELGGEEPLVHAEVERSAIASVVADWTGIPVGKLRAASLSELLDLERSLEARIRGQGDAVRVVAEAVRMAYAGVRDPEAPVAVLLFVGPSGVGKTETALALAELLYGGERQMTTINMSEYQEKHTVSRLIGSPPGYVGYGEGGVLSEAVRQRPHSVVLLDECEKADLEVMNLFYQVFDKGALKDGEGRLIDFRHALVILTSNLATEAIVELQARTPQPSHEEIAAAIRPILSRHFKPALLARMTVVPYRPVDATVLASIAELKLAKLGARLGRAHGLSVEFDRSAIDALVARCVQAESGARLLDHLLRGSLMPALARTILGALAEGGLGERLRVAHDGGQWRVELDR